MGIKKFFRTKFGDLLKDNEFLLKIFNRILRLSRLSTFYYEQEKRKTLSILDYKGLAAPIPFCPLETIREANYYGNVHMLREYCNLKSEDGKITMEHGLMYGEYLQKWYNLKTVKKIITFNDKRKNLIEKKLNKECLAIGPYIHYCNGLLTDKEISSLKQKYGKILLFIPVHSTQEGKNEYDIQKQIKDICIFKDKHSFDSVWVCMHFYDINNFSYHNLYEKAGFNIVTAGNVYDINFLPRLKSIISLADYTLSNAVGTHTGYCIYLNKPHYIPWEIDSQKNPADYNEIGDEFKEYNSHITSKQLDIVSKYWGFNEIKSKEEITDFITH